MPNPLQRIAALERAVRSQRPVAGEGIMVSPGLFGTVIDAAAGEASGAYNGPFAVAPFKYAGGGISFTVKGGTIYGAKVSTLVHEIGWWRPAVVPVPADSTGDVYILVEYAWEYVEHPEFTAFADFVYASDTPPVSSDTRAVYRLAHVEAGVVTQCHYGDIHVNGRCVP